MSRAHKFRIDINTLDIGLKKKPARKCTRNRAKSNKKKGFTQSYIQHTHMLAHTKPHTQRDTIDVINEQIKKNKTILLISDFAAT